MLEILNLIERVRAWIVLARAHGRGRRQQLLEALARMHRAANITRLFLSEVAARQAARGQAVRAFEDDDLRISFGPMSFSGAAGVSDAWIDAGRALGEVWAEADFGDRFFELAQRCFAKAGYYAAPSSSRSGDLDIRLDQLVKDIETAIEAVRRGDREYDDDGE